MDLHVRYAEFSFMIGYINVIDKAVHQQMYIYIDSKGVHCTLYNIPIIRSLLPGLLLGRVRFLQRQVFQIVTDR